MEVLSSKAYWRALPESPEFVVLYLPGEPFLSAALAHDPSLLDDAFQRKIVLATPSTLVALLRTVSLVWGEGQSHERAQAIMAVGRQLTDHLAGTNEALRQVGQSLHTAVAAYNHAITRLETQVGPLATRLATAGVGPVRTSAIPKPVLIQPRPIAGAVHATPPASATMANTPATSKPVDPSGSTQAGRSQPSV
jgi:DNA recombination protein RmuC